MTLLLEPRLAPGWPDPAPQDQVPFLFPPSTRVCGTSPYMGGIISSWRVRVTARSPSTISHRTRGLYGTAGPVRTTFPTRAGVRRAQHGPPAPLTRLPAAGGAHQRGDLVLGADAIPDRRRFSVSGSVGEHRPRRMASTMAPVPPRMWASRSDAQEAGRPGSPPPSRNSGCCRHHHVDELRDVGLQREGRWFPPISCGLTTRSARGAPPPRLQLGLAT
jgi:hypothetical protein